MKKLKLMGLMATAFLITVGPVAQARDCELPHEQLEARCQGSENSEAISAIEKAPKRDLKQIVASYRDKSQGFTSMVEKAEEDYQAYRAKKRAQLPK